MTLTSKPTLFIVGPTAVGKTRLAVALAQRFSGEIVNADSRQVYRHMDIGTGKPTSEERAQAPHHLLDLLDPGQDFSLGFFLPLARAQIQKIHEVNKLPIVAGGTGQYVFGLLEGWKVPEVPPDPVFREAKQQEAERLGGQVLYHELQGIDPERAAELDPRNVRRVIRALEIHHASRRLPSGFPRRASPVSNPLVIGLGLARDTLYQRIDSRVDGMMAGGFLDEVRGLARMGYPMGKGPLASPGYRELGQHLAGEIDLPEAVQRTKYQTHRLARRQGTWFKAGDPRITWLDADHPDLDEQAGDHVGRFLASLPAVVK